MIIIKIGEKIKNLRTSKMMTQSELAGDSITRNMLSRIENGAALPSLPTLVYLSERLKVPAGYLIADEDNEFIYRKINHIDNIKRAYNAGEFRMCRSLCINGLKHTDDETALILAVCCINIAKELFHLGKLKAACKYFDETFRYCAQTVYFTENMKAEISIYYSYLVNRISQTLCSEENIPDYCVEIAFCDSFCRYVTASSELLNNNKQRVRSIIKTFGSKDAYYASFLEAKLLVSEASYSQAAHIMMDILNSEQSVGNPVLYDILSSLEICCREIKDYKNAYEFATNRVAIVEKMLSDTGE